jgi:hypothetical protein
MLLVLGLAGAALWGLGFGGRSEAGLTPHLPRLIVLLVVVGGILGTATVWLWPIAARSQPMPIGAVETTRTALLVGAVLAVALGRRVSRFAEANWLVYVLLACAGLKFLLEDVRASQSGTLFVAFALYGLALIAGAHLRRTPHAAATPGRREAR